MEQRLYNRLALNIMYQLNITKHTMLSILSRLQS